MSGNQSAIVTSLEVDVPLVQDANYRFNENDRQYIDNQIRGVQQHLVNALIRGQHATYVRVSSDNVDLIPGDVVCLASQGSEPEVVSAVSEALGNVGAVFGVVVLPVVAGAFALVAFGGVLPPSVTGLDVGTGGFVRVNTSTARCERVDTLSGGDYGVGFLSPSGYLQITPGIVGGAAVTPMGTETLALSTGANNNVAVATATATAVINGVGVEISGITGGASGRTLLLVAFEDVLTIHDEGEGSTAANRIVTGVGDPLLVPPGGVVSLRYDTVSSRWLVTGVSNAIQPADAFQVAVYNGQGQIGSAGRQVPEGDFVGTTGEQTLTNKTISGSSNTITNISGSSVSAATTGAAGTMSAADKTKLDGIQKQGSTTLVTALAIDWSQSSTFSKTISTSSTFTFSNATDGQCVIVAITAGSGNTVTWPTVKWAGGVAPTQTSSGTDVYTFVKIGSTIYGSVVQAMA